MNYILGVDLGGNFSYKLFNYTTYKIIKWSHLKIKNYHCIEKSCIDVMNQLLDLDLLKTGSNLDTILILLESQPKINIKTVRMAGQVQMYFVIQQQLFSNSSFKNEDVYSSEYATIKKIIHYPSSNKLKYYTPLPGDPMIKTKYASAHYRNKQIAKQHCSIILKREHPEWVSFYESSKKKDDLADCCLMVLAYVKFVIKGQSSITNTDNEIVSFRVSKKPRVSKKVNESTEQITTEAILVKKTRKPKKANESTDIEHSPKKTRKRSKKMQNIINNLTEITKP